MKIGNQYWQLKGLLANKFKMPAHGQDCLMLCLMALLIFSACGRKPDSRLDEMVAERDSLQKITEKLTVDIKSLNRKIAELDTTLSKNKRKTFVEVMTLSKDTFIHTFEVQGLVKASKNVLIAPDMAGRVKEIKVSEGDHVTQGQALIILDSEVIRKNIQEVETALELATDVYNRQKNLWDQEIGSEMQFLEAKNRLQALKDRRATFRAQLDKTIIKAPFSGSIEEVIPKLGETVTPGVPAVRLINLDHVKINADVSERYIGRINRGDKVTIKFPLLEKTLSARISRIGNYINPENRTFQVEVRIDNPPDLLKPNLLTVIEIADLKMDSVIIVPGEFVLADGEGNTFVYVAPGNESETVAKKVMVETGLTENDQTVILEGLSGNERLITLGARTVTDGEKVTVKNTTDTGNADARTSS